jgi:general nucleoside transport system permease protein
MTEAKPSSTKNASDAANALWPLILLLLTLVVLGLTIKLAAPDKDPAQALKALFLGAFGSQKALASTATNTLILVLYASGIVLSFRAGLINIGAEGQSRVGAALTAALATAAWGEFLASIPLLGIPLVVIAGAVAGASWSLLAGVLREWRGVPEVIGTLLLNFLGLLLVSFFVNDARFLRSGTYQQSAEVAGTLQLRGWNGTEFHSGVLLMVPAVLLLHLFLSHTRSGFFIRAMGLNASAARTCGAPVRRLNLAVFAIAGALAGSAGAIGVLSRGRLDQEPTYPEYGFMAIAVALVADLRPLWVLPAATLFAALEVGTRSMERNAGVSHHVVYLVEGVIIVAILIRGVQVLKKRGGSAAAEAAA